MREDINGEGVIDLPGKYLLTDSGVKYFVRRQIPLRDLRTRNGSKGSGIVWRRYEPENIKRFIAYELLAEIEIERIEFLTRRGDIMSLTNQTVSGILEKRFRPELKQIIRESDVFSPIRDGIAMVSPEKMQNYVKKNERAIRVLQKSLLLEPIEKIENETEMPREEREERIEVIKKIVASIDIETWFLLSIIPDKRGREQLMRSIEDLLLVYTARFRITDYVSLMLMELLQYAERTQILNFAERDQYIRTHPDKLASRLADPSFREKLFQRAAASHSLLSLNYQFSGNPYNPTRGPEMQITVVNKGLVGYESRRHVLSKRTRNVRNIPLSRFYQTETPSQLDTTLGIHYLSYVEQACDSVGVGFDAEIERDEDKEETRTRVNISL